MKLINAQLHETMHGILGTTPRAHLLCLGYHTSTRAPSSSSSPSSVCNNFVQLYNNVYCPRGHKFRLVKQHHTVNRYCNSFVSHIINVLNSLPASAFD